MNTKIITAILLTLTFSSCVKKIMSDPDIEEAIYGQIQSGDTVLNLDMLLGFEWDSMFILGPYTPLDWYEDTLDINLKPIEHSGIEYLDHFNLLVFVYQGEIINMSEYPLGFGDFIKTDNRYIKKGEASFDIIYTDRKSSSGTTWIEIRKQNINYP